MKRGEIWTVSDSGYSGKPRPAVIIQGDEFPGVYTVAICTLTTLEVDAPLVRVSIKPDGENGLREPSWVMIDKVSAVRTTKIGQRLGAVGATDIANIDKALRSFLALD